MVDQLTYWNGPSGERWAREQVALDAMLHPFGAATLDAARVAAGEAVVDVGCGCGETALALGVKVGRGGRVVGLDVSAPMLALARTRGAERPNVSFIEGDASSARLDPGAFDLLFSRFGVMFFTDPTRAFAHLRSALRPEGRVAFACWQEHAANPWATVPLDAAATVLGRPDTAAPEAPGPFSFSDPIRVRRILEGAGYHDVNFHPFETTLVFGDRGDIAAAATEIARLGPVARLLVDRDEKSVSQALAAIRAVLPPYVRSGGGVSLPAASWIVTATNRDL